MFDNNSLFLLSGVQETHKQEVVDHFVVNSIKNKKKCLYVNTNRSYKEILDRLLDSGLEENDIKKFFDFIDLSGKQENKKYSVLSTTMERIDYFMSEIEKLQKKNKYNKAVFHNFSDISNYSCFKSENLMEHCLKDLKHNGVTVLIHVSNDLDLDHFLNLEINSDVSLEVFSEEGKILISTNGILQKEKIKQQMEKQEFIENYFLS